MDKIKEAEIILEKYKQKKIKTILEKLDGEKKEKLADQITKIDFEKIFNLYKNKDKKEQYNEEIEPIEFLDKNKLTKEQEEKIANIGEKIIRDNQYAVVTMAGGQGTRLGWKGPKGTFKLDVGENGKYIFEILVDTLKEANKKYGSEILWYIMTSIDNNEQTIKFFEEHNYFGYNKEKIKFFTQDVLPLVDTEGNLLIGNDYKIKEASDGNGGVFSSLKNKGMFDDMKNNGVKWIYICGVDNIMVNMVDPVLLGLAIKRDLPSASKSVKKAYPEEKVGIFCKKNGKPAIIEYIDMTDDMIYERNEDGELLYGETNIVSHLINIDSLEEIIKHKLKYHCAKKKNAYIDENLKEVIPSEPNTYKFEKFIFDAFEYLKDMAVLRVNREDEFAPIKNATGLDSPESAKKIYENKHKEIY